MSPGREEDGGWTLDEDLSDLGSEGEKPVKSDQKGVVREWLHTQDGEIAEKPNKFEDGECGQWVKCCMEFRGMMMQERSFL